MEASAADALASMANIGEPIDNPSVDPRLDHSVGRPGILYKNHHIMQVDYVRDLTYAGPYFNI